MAWKRLIIGRSPIRRRSKLHLDESVPAAVEQLLQNRGYRPSTSRQRCLTGHSDADHAAVAWRESRIVVTFDWDFFEHKDIPTHRAPGVVILDCDRAKAGDVGRAVYAFAEFERVIGAVNRRTRLVARADGEVSVWRTAGPREAPNERYRFRPMKAPMVSVR
jgi:predicted nuclease of predicted toxin-antitoxin system